MVENTGNGEAGHQLVAFVDFLKEIPDFNFAHGLRQVLVALEADALRDFGIKVVESLHADTLEHLLDVFFSMWKEFVSHSIGNNLNIANRKGGMKTPLT